MPAESEKQRRLAAMTLAYKRGKSKRPPKSKGMMGMSEKDLEDYAEKAEESIEVVDAIAEMITDDPDIFTEKKLTYKARKGLPKSSFAIPEKRKYPIHDESHARNALSRVSAHGTPEEKRRVRAAVKRRYPGIEQSKD